MRDGKVAQARADLDAYQGSLASIDRQIELIDEEIATVEDLLRKGLDRKPRLLALQRARADLDGERNAAVASAQGTRELIVATQAERSALISGRSEEVAIRPRRGAGRVQSAAGGGPRRPRPAGAHHDRGAGRRPGGGPQAGHPGRRDRPGRAHSRPGAARPAAGDRGAHLAAGHRRRPRRPDGRRPSHRVPHPQPAAGPRRGGAGVRATG